MKSEAGRGDKECKRGRNRWIVKSEIEDEDGGEKERRREGAERYHRGLCEAPVM